MFAIRSWTLILEVNSSRGIGRNRKKLQELICRKKILLRRGEKERVKEVSLDESVIKNRREGAACTLGRLIMVADLLQNAGMQNLRIVEKLDTKATDMLGIKAYLLSRAWKIS